jgi:hypothetical protein
MKMYNEIFYRQDFVLDYFIFFSTPRLKTEAIDNLYYIETDLCTTFLKPIPTTSPGKEYYQNYYYPIVQESLKALTSKQDDSGRCVPQVEDFLKNINASKADTMIDFVLCQGLSLRGKEKNIWFCFGIDMIYILSKTNIFHLKI